MWSFKTPNLWAAKSYIERLSRIPFYWCTIGGFDLEPHDFLSTQVNRWAKNAVPRNCGIQSHFNFSVSYSELFFMSLVFVWITDSSKVELAEPTFKLGHSLSTYTWSFLSQFVLQGRVLSWDALRSAEIGQTLWAEPTYVLLSQEYSMVFTFILRWVLSHTSLCTISHERNVFIDSVLPTVSFWNSCLLIQ